MFKKKDCSLDGEASNYFTVQIFLTVYTPANRPRNMQAFNLARKSVYLEINDLKSLVELLTFQYQLQSKVLGENLNWNRSWRVI